MVETGDGRVGRIWAGPHPRRPQDPRAAWLYCIEVDRHHRGHGYARAGLALVEADLAQRGITEFGLNVFGGSSAARHLYATSGYREVAVTMSKGLSASDT